MYKFLYEIVLIFLFFSYLVIRNSSIQLNREKEKIEREQGDFNTIDNPVARGCYELSIEE